jgi:hypothetical protein
MKRVTARKRKPMATRRIRGRLQKCTVRCSFKRNTPGIWLAHGYYISRPLATALPRHESGFDAESEVVDITQRVEEWGGKPGEDRLWKIILSPERGLEMDLRKLTRDVMEQVAKDVGHPLEWVAAAHYWKRDKVTKAIYRDPHPHVHVALRSIDLDGRRVRMNRDYLWAGGLRGVAMQQCTRQLGYRFPSPQEIEASNGRILGRPSYGLREAPREL